MFASKARILAAVLGLPALAGAQWSATEQTVFSLEVYGVGDGLGHSVALDGDTVVAGAPWSGDDEGAAAVFVKSGSTWVQQAKLLAGKPDPGDHFGWSVAISGDLVVVGALPILNATRGGAAHVFARSGSSWSLQQVLRPSDGEPGDVFGTSVAISGDTVLVGAKHDRTNPDLTAKQGSAYAFTWNGVAWVEAAKLVSDDGLHLDYFGEAIALDGDTALIGAPGVDLDRGAVYWFQRSGSSWTQVQKLTSSSLEVNDRFGLSLDFTDDTALIGAPGFVGEGSAYFFAWNGSSWSELQEVGASAPTYSNHFGAGVTIESDVALIGAHDEDTAAGTRVGAAYLFGRVAGTWSEQGQLTASDAEASDFFGSSVAISGTMLVIGSEGADFPQAPGAGVVYEFKTWPQAEAYCTAGTSTSGCQAVLGTIGGPSASASSGYTVTASEVEGQKDGLFYFGVNGRQAQPWGPGSSFQCVIPPVSRTGLLTGTGTVNTCEGAFALDLNAYWCPSCPAPQKNPGVGAVVQAQLWYRDPFSTSTQTTSLSNAIEFQLAP